MSKLDEARKRLLDLLACSIDDYEHRCREVEQAALNFAAAWLEERRVPGPADEARWFEDDERWYSRSSRNPEDVLRADGLAQMSKPRVETKIIGTRPEDDLGFTVTLIPDTNDPGGYEVNLTQSSGPGDEGWICMSIEEARMLMRFLSEYLEER